MAGSLFSYMQYLQRFLRDAKQEIFDPGDLISYINQARRETAMRSQSVRILPRVSDAVTSIQLTSGGSGYTAPTVTITTPDFPSGMLPFPQGAQATATAQVLDGVVVSVNVTYGGAGYFQPLVTITDATGTGAEAVATTAQVNVLQQGQEVYNFSDINLAPFPGIGAIYMVRGVSVIYSNYRYSLPMYSWSVYNAMIRQYVASQYQYVPCFGAQFGQGTGGSLYMYPPPSQTYQMEWDCQCLPQDLIDDQSVEVIPDPWTDAVPFYAAHLAFLEAQNWNSARGMLELFDQRMARFRSYVEPGRTTNPYGRW